MTEEIKQMIEEEAERLCNSRFNLKGKIEFGDIYTQGIISGSEFGYNLCLSKWQEAERWRKVEEELPECRDNDYQVLGLLKNGEYKTIWVIKDSIPQIEVFDYHGVTEWKPIS